jgi:hypothetical protein
MHRDEANESSSAVSPGEDAAPSRARRSALSVAGAWGRAMDALDEEALIALAHPEIEIVAPGGTRRGRDALRDWLGKQTYGVVPRFERRRAFARDETVAIDLRVEFRYLDGGEVAGTEEAATVITVSDGLVRRIALHPDLESALVAAGLDETDEAPI